MGRGFKLTLGIAAVQSSITVLAGLVALIFYTKAAAGSAVTGGLIGIVTTGFWGLRAFAGGQFQPAGKMLTALYTGEIQKIALTVILFVVAAKWLKVLFFPMLTVYALTLMAFWLVLPFCAISEKK